MVYQSLHQPSTPIREESQNIRVPRATKNTRKDSGPMIEMRTLSSLLFFQNKSKRMTMLNPKYATMLTAARIAQENFALLGQHDADRIFTAVAKSANKVRVHLAKLAAEETRMGCVEDKVLKNGLACELIWDRYKDSKTCGLITGDDTHGKRLYASPVGPIAALTPVTNPTSTAISKALMMAKTRNAGIFLPHPRAEKCTAEAVRICMEAGVEAGAPPDWIQCVQGNHSVLDSQEIMKHENINLILATGGPAMVKASYSCGKPAISVGSGNAPVLVDETADIHLAVGSIILGKTFDNGMICAAEQSVVAVEPIYDDFKHLLEDRGVFFLTGQDHERLADFIEKDGHINPDIVGQTAQEIARRAEIQTKLPPDTVVLATEECVIGEEHPLSKEKLSPVISLYKATSFEDGVRLCKELVLNGGKGHTAGMYTSFIDRNGSLSREERFLSAVPVHRVLINSPTSLAAIGSAFNFAIDPSFTLGVGTSAGSSVSTNLGPAHLLNITTLAERQDHIEWFKLPPQIFFNRGCLEEALRGIAVDGEKKALIVTDKGMMQTGILQRVVSCLQNEGLQVEVFSDVMPDPNEECVRAGVKACKSFEPDLMICLGGGSPIDAGKYIRAQYEHPELTLEDASTRFIEIRKRTCPFPRLGSRIRKLVAIPTTSGTGSEVSPFTVITSDDGQKYPLASYKLTPQIAICDSTLCDSLPKSLVAYAGLDSITHAIESFVSVAQNDFTRPMSLEALDLLFKFLPQSYQTGSSESRDACHRAATLAGIAFSNAFLGIGHSLAHKVGAQFHLPHGMACAILLPHVITYNASEKPTRMGIYPSYDYPQAAERYSAIAKRIGASSYDAKGLNEMVTKVMSKVNCPLTFRDAGVNEKAFLDNLDAMAEHAFDDQCTSTNPRYPIVSELKEILLDSYYGDITKLTKHGIDEDETTSTSMGETSSENEEQLAS